jgi:hypothetical protein
MFQIGDRRMQIADEEAGLMTSSGYTRESDRDFWIERGGLGMTFDELADWTKQIGLGQKLSSAARKRIATELPAFIRQLSPSTAPRRWRLPTGESLGDATRMTALKCQCLLLARFAFGSNYAKANLEYERLAKDVLFWVMRHGFNSEDPKGVFCCPPCTLSLLPLYATSSFRWVDCAELKSNVLGALQRGDSVFKRSYPKAYAEWAVELSHRRK